MHATYRVTTEPTMEPITLAELKEALRELSDDRDREITRMLKVARRAVEHDTARRLCTQTVKLYLDRFPDSQIIEIRELPVISITSLKYLDTDAAEQTVASSEYHEDLDSTPARIQLKTGNTWPTEDDDTPNVVYLEYQAGYGDASAVPVEAKQAVIRWAQLSWSNCGEQIAGDNLYNNLINQLRWTGYHLV